MNQSDSNYFQTWFVFLSRKLDTIINIVCQIQQGEKQMSLDISALQTAVANETTVEKSAITLLAQLAQEIQSLAANAVDPATVQALSDLATQINTNASALSAAVVANTQPTTTTAAPGTTPAP